MEKENRHKRFIQRVYSEFVEKVVRLSLIVWKFTSSFNIRCKKKHLEAVLDSLHIQELANFQSALTLPLHYPINPNSLIRLIHLNPTVEILIAAREHILTV